MSAIAGIFNLNKEPVSRENIMAMMGAFQKFPSDDVGIWNKNHIFLGCHAQWITPESIGEQLPFYDYERQCAITADCIIDNRDELFEALQVDYEERKTIPDSLLILLAYYKWGEDCPKYLIGDFAFMIWDEKEQKLFGARDFSGTRTLYFYRDHNRFAFSTTIQPLLDLPYIKKELNEEWLAQYLAIPSVHDAADTRLTPYVKIEQILPSHRFSIYKDKVKLFQYINLKPKKKLRLKSNDEYVEAFQSLFSQAVSSRLRTYKNVGAQLSGGLDSGSVVAFASKILKENGKPLYTFSSVPIVGYKNWLTKARVPDERPYIKETVSFVGNIDDNYYSFEQRNPYSEIDQWLDVIEVPYKSFSNSYWTRGIYEEANKKNIGILLKGSRGNYSISWGPGLDYYAKLLKKIKWIKLYKELTQYCQYRATGKSIILRTLSKRAFPLFQKQKSEPFPTLISEEFAAKSNVYEKLSQFSIDFNEDDTVYQAREKQFEHLYFWHINGIIGSKFSLQYSLWDRDPTSDLRIIQFCQSIPEDQYVQKGMDRALIRRATKNLLPDTVRQNYMKRGIQGADVIQRLSSSWPQLIKEFYELLNDPFISLFINKLTIKTALEDIQENPKAQYVFDPRFNILMRGLILRRFIHRNFERG